MVQLNIQALVDLTHACLPPMLARKKGRIVQIASVAAWIPGPFFAIYYASKAFVHSFTLALHKELRGTGVSVMIVYPGPTSTHFGEASGVDLNHPAMRFSKRNFMSAESVAKITYQAMRTNTLLCIPGWNNRLLRLLVKLMPLRSSLHIAALLNHRAWMSCHKK